MNLIEYPTINEPQKGEVHGCKWKSMMLWWALSDSIIHWLIWSCSLLIHKHNRNSYLLTASKVCFIYFVLYNLFETAQEVLGVVTEAWFEAAGGCRCWVETESSECEEFHCCLNFQIGTNEWGRETVRVCYSGMSWK